MHGDRHAAIVDARVQSALTREFGVSWVARTDGMGHEIAGIAQQTLDAFSTRAHRDASAVAPGAPVGAQTRAGAECAGDDLPGPGGEQDHRGAKDGQIDWDKLTAGWDATLGGELAVIAEQVCDFDARPGEAPTAPPREVQERAIQQALASVQAERSTWTRGQLMKNLAWAMGQDFAHMSADARQGLLVQITGQALGVGYGVQCLEAPEWPLVPRSLIRDLDGRSVYTRPGVTRYATLGQLAMEQRMCQQAQRQGAPALAREFCAAQLGADADVLDAQLGTGARRNRLDAPGCAWTRPP